MLTWVYAVVLVVVFGITHWIPAISTVFHDPSRIGEAICGSRVSAGIRSEIATVEGEEVLRVIVPENLCLRQAWTYIICFGILGLLWVIGRRDLSMSSLGSLFWKGK
jgi:hypothetical protein